MRRWRLAPGRGVALSVAMGLLAVGCAATAPATSTAPVTSTAQATAKAPATGPDPAATTAQADRQLAGPGQR
jgi:hypothetical protein